MTFRLTRAAESDMVNIYVRGATDFGVAQAESYADRLDASIRLIGEMPLIARERHELNPPVRIHPVLAHVIVYEITQNHVVILRIRHQSENWVAAPI